MVLFNGICCGPQSGITSTGNSKHWGQGCKAKCWYLPALLMAIPEAWCYLVYLWMEGFPQNACIAVPVKDSDLSSLLLQKPGSMYLLFSEMEAQDSKTSQSQKRLLALKWGGSSSQIHSSQTSELDDIILILKNIRWSASHLGFSSWYKYKKLRSTDCVTNMTFNRSNSGPVPLLFLQGIKCQAIAEGKWYSDSSPTILTKQIQ